MKKIFLGIFLLCLAGCGSIPQCGTRSISFQVPSAVPFMGNAPFTIERKNDHVDCGPDEEEAGRNFIEGLLDSNG